MSPEVGRAPPVPDRSGNSGESRSLTDSAYENGPRPIHLVGGRSCAVGVGFEPTVTSLPRRFSRLSSLAGCIARLSDESLHFHDHIAEASGLHALARHPLIEAGT